MSLFIAVNLSFNNHVRTWHKIESSLTHLIYTFIFFLDWSGQDQLCLSWCVCLHPSSFISSFSLFFLYIMTKTLRRSTGDHELVLSPLPPPPLSLLACCSPSLYPHLTPSGSQLPGGSHQALPEWAPAAREVLARQSQVLLCLAAPTLGDDTSSLPRLGDGTEAMQPLPQIWWKEL